MGEVWKICLYYIFGEKYIVVVFVSENVEVVGVCVLKWSLIFLLIIFNFVYYECV